MGFWEIVGIISTFITTILGAITWVQVQKAKIIKRERIREEAQLQRITDVVLSKLGDHMLEGFPERTKDLVRKKDFEPIVEKVEQVEKVLQENANFLVEFEKGALRSEILNFSEDLKNGIHKSGVAYQHIYSVFARYKKLGGNSYIHDVFDEIKKTQRGIKETTDFFNKDSKK